ncbi:MAG: NBR1-Ig-like domain-containing protein [Anaerolineales bacterium]
MFRLNKFVLTSLVILVVAALTACGPGQAVAPTPTAVDLNAIQTAAVATVNAQLTLNAPTIAPVFTLTLLPSETPPAGITNTPGGVILEGTPSLTIAATLPFGATAIPSFTPIGGGIIGGGGTAVSACKNAIFEGDITIPDGTVMKPWEKFTKAWSVRNTGTCRWDEGFYFAGVSGPPSMIAHPYYFRTKKDFIAPGASVDIYIDMYAPGDPGEYVAHWHMYDDQSKPFGGDFTVDIKVVK